MSTSTEERYLGCLLGLACGDAVGTTVEFKPRGSFEPLTDMVGGGPFRLEPGQWTDDTSMALCLGTSLLVCDGFDPADQMRRYVRWWRDGYLSSTGACFDIGNTVAGALQRFQQSDIPYSGSTDPWSAGNGSIMRLAPVPMFYADDMQQVAYYAAESSRTTHGAQEAVDASRLFGVMLALALQGATQAEILSASHLEHFSEEDLAPAIRDIAQGGYQNKGRDEIKGSGYVVQSLEAALWCFWQTDTYRDAILLAANLGDDADTTAAICGQIAGAFYGVGAIPETWLAKLAERELIQDLAQQLFAGRTN